MIKEAGRVSPDQAPTSGAGEDAVERFIQTTGNAQSSRWKRRLFQRWSSEHSLMAKIIQALTRASKEYDQRTFQSLVRDLDAVINKLNTSFQQELQTRGGSSSLSLLNNGS